ncbi:MAG: type I glyceraldehyde-3-phosphate dehydrogenase [Candidatus Aenigmarchaeota archaeon]|nr:type I glyceraldehyde-3-phosphate dehydrogenase [Candidatus Aenigmarchaeota archaeon]
MVVKVALNGPGRTGKTFIWSWAEKKRRGETDAELVAINGVRDVDKDKGLRNFVNLLKYDSAHGFRFDDLPYGRDDDGTAWIEILGRKIYLYNNRGDLSSLPWRKHEIDVVVEATGKFRKREQAEGHLKAGAKKVVISAPSKGGVETSVVLGVRENIPENEQIIDCASCTTNAIAFVVKAVDDKWKIKRGFIVTVHAPTDDQRILDSSHKDIRRARSLLSNIIPTTTGAAKSVVKVLPHLNGRLDAIAFRVPSVLTGSIVGLIAEVEKETDANEVNEYFDHLASNELKGIASTIGEEIVSSQIIGRTESGIVDKTLTKVINGHTIVVWSWYDNEFGYSTRLVEVAEKFGKM